MKEKKIIIILIVLIAFSIFTGLGVTAYFVVTGQNTIVEKDLDDSSDSKEEKEEKKEKTKKKEENQEKEEDEKEEPKKEESKPEPSRELTRSEKLLLEIGKLLDEGLAFDVGSYIKGDIPAGEYAFVKFEGSGSYYCEKDAAGNIVDNENFDSFGYVKVHSVGNLETKGVLINVNTFERLGVSGAREIYELLNDQSNWNQAGYYKVGYDIEPGKYVLESIGSGYWAILTGPVSNNDIVDNDNFNGKATVNLKKGQYLELSRAFFTKAQ